MALLSLQAFKTKWAAITGRFKDNNTFDIAEKDYREFSTDIADSLFEPVESLRTRVEKLEQPAPPAPDGAKWNVYPKVSVEGNTVKATPSEVEFHGNKLPLPTPNANENVPLPPAGWGERIDILAASADGWVYIYGQDPGVTPAFVHPDQPDAELLFAAYLFWSNAGGAVEDPVVFVRVVEMDGQEYTPDANGRLKLPKGGTTINSTDDIQSEGAANKWFTDARAIAARATVNLWSYLGLTNSTATISLKGWLDFLTNKVKANEEGVTRIDKERNYVLAFDSYNRLQRVLFTEKVMVEPVIEHISIATVAFQVFRKDGTNAAETTNVATLNSTINSLTSAQRPYTIAVRITLSSGKNFGELVLRTKLL